MGVIIPDNGSFSCYTFLEIAQAINYVFILNLSNPDRPGRTQETEMLFSGALQTTLGSPN
jgi:hypothetical protein